MYQSDITRFLKDLRAERPHLEQAQRDGRAIWWDAMQHFPDLQACRQALQVQGVQTLQALAQLTRATGHGWRPDYSALGHIQSEGELCAAYV